MSLRSLGLATYFDVIGYGLGVSCVPLPFPAVPVGPGKCRLLNRNTFRFTKGGLGARVARAVMKVAPGWAVHMGTQVWDAFQQQQQQLVRHPKNTFHYYDYIKVQFSS